VEGEHGKKEERGVNLGGEGWRVAESEGDSKKGKKERGTSCEHEIKSNSLDVEEWTMAKVGV